MLLKKTGMDIASKIGGVKNYEDAKKLFKDKMDHPNLSKMEKIQSPEVNIRVANIIRMCGPENVFIHTGCCADRKFVKNLALRKKEEAPLALDKHTIHFDLKEEQGRIIDRTFYIYDYGEKISSLANKVKRAEALNDVKSKMLNIMKDKTMIVGFYLRGPIGSPVSNLALEITSSAYVIHSADLLYRNAFIYFNQEVGRLKHFYTNIHSEGLNRLEDLPNARVYMDRTHQTTYSVNCTYAGNTLMLKKGNHRFSVDRAVYKNRGFELSEHMFITGIRGPNDRITWCAGASPSGCGKTTTAMSGDQFIGDDLAQFWIDEAGAIRAVNPEIGIFGILEDVNREGDSILMDCLKNPGTEVIWSNVLIDAKGIPHWTGNGEPAPQGGRNYQGVWHSEMLNEKGNVVPISHPNARCTMMSQSLANYSEKAEKPGGVEISIITYSGRDSDTMPPVWAAKNTDQGVVIGATIVSEATTTEVGATGVRRAPWANAPFIPGPLGDYMDAQFRFFGNKKIAKDKKPIMAGLNYFLIEKARGGKSSKLIGEKKDVKVWLSWLERLSHHDLTAIETPIGYIPLYNDLKDLFESLIQKRYSFELYIKQFSLYLDNIIGRIDLQIKAFSTEPNIPEKFSNILRHQKRKLVAMKEKYGPIVSPELLDFQDGSDSKKQMS